MSKQFLLPRPSGPPLVVDVSEAGRVISTPEGEQIQVPAYRDLVRLEPHVEKQADLDSSQNLAMELSCCGCQKAWLGFALMAGSAVPANLTSDRFLTM